MPRYPYTPKKKAVTANKRANAAATEPEKFRVPDTSKSIPKPIP
jgi:hypothetical protein